jgi:hypothetical protein
MTTTASASTAMAVTEPVFSPQERLALAEFLAGPLHPLRSIGQNTVGVGRMNVRRAVAGRVSMPGIYGCLCLESRSRPATAWAVHLGERAGRRKPT